MADYKKSALHEYHIESGAKFAPYSAWSIVLNYANGQIIEQEYANKDAVIFDNSFITKFNLSIDSQDFNKINKLFAYSLENQSVNTIQENLILNDNGNLIDKVTIFKMSDNGYFIFSSVERCKIVENHIKLYFTQNNIKKSQFDNLTDYLGCIVLYGPSAIEALEKLGFTDTNKLVKNYCGAIEIANCRAIIGVIEDDSNQVEIQFICSEDYIEDLWIALYNTEPIFPIGFTAYNNIQLDKELGLNSYQINQNINPVVYNLINKNELNKEFIGDNKINEFLTNTTNNTIAIVKLPSRRLAFENSQVLLEKDDRNIGFVVKSYQSFKHNSAMAYVELTEKINKSENLLIKNENECIKAQIIELFDLN